jgi:DNA-binding response OmpR family regulator
MGKRVLLAGNREESAQPIREALAAAGYSVISVSNGAECCCAADEAVPDLIVLEARMPVLDGLATLQVLREHQNTEGLPVIMLSDTELKGGGRLGWAAAADMHLLRPISAGAVVAAANWLLHRSPRWPRG